MHVARTFTVSRPITEVFDYLSDFEHTNEWDPGTVETRRAAGDGGLGTTYSNRSQFIGRETELTYETVGFTRPTFFACRGINKTATAIDSMTFSESITAPIIVPRKLESLADETLENLATS